MTAATTAAATPGRKRAAPGPMTAAKAIRDIERLRAKASETEDTILAQLPETDRNRVIAFFGAK